MCDTLAITYKYTEQSRWISLTLSVFFGEMLNAVRLFVNHRNSCPTCNTIRFGSTTTLFFLLFFLFSLLGYSPPCVHVLRPTLLPSPSHKRNLITSTMFIQRFSDATLSEIDPPAVYICTISCMCCSDQRKE